MRLTPSQRIIKILFAKSGNQCAYPSCKFALVEDNNILVGDVCHINSEKPKGPRFNPDLVDNDLTSYDNFILFCCNHHRYVDALPEKYTPNVLKEMKRKHEKNVFSAVYEPPKNVVEEALVRLISEELSTRLSSGISNLEYLIETGSIWQQQPMNMVATSISTILDVKLVLILSSISQNISASDFLDIVKDQERWEQDRLKKAKKAGSKYAEGTFEPMERALMYNDLTKKRLIELKRFIQYDNCLKGC